MADGIVRRSQRRAGLSCKFVFRSSRRVLIRFVFFDFQHPFERVKRCAQPLNHQQPLFLKDGKIPLRVG
jgi:hypothetical protein